MSVKRHLFWQSDATLKSKTMCHLWQRLGTNRVSVGVTAPIVLSLLVSISLPVAAASLGTAGRSDAGAGGQVAQENLEELQDFDYWKNLCELQVDASKFAEAQKSCEAGIELRPRDSDIWAIHSGILLSLKQLPESIASAEQSILFNANNSLAWTYKCMAYNQLGQTEEALDACNEALRVNGNWGRQSPALAWFQRGQILSQMGDYEEALVAYERTLLLEPGDSLTLTRRCEALMHLREYSDALKACQDALAGNEHWGDENPGLAWYFQGLSHRYAGMIQLDRGNKTGAMQSFVDAIAAFDQSINIDPNNTRTWADQGWVLETLKRYPEALTSYSRAVEIKPDSARALVGQCAMLNKTEQYEMAVEACGKAIQGDGDWWEIGAAQAWSQQAHALTGLGQYEDALASSNRAVGIKPDYAEAWSDRSVILWYLQRFDEAIASCQKAIELDPTYARPWANLGRILRTLGQFEPALSAYEKALELQPDDAETWANRSVVLWYMQRFDTAVLSANQAININPRLFQGWYNRATALVALRRYSEALTAYDQALRLDQTNADAWAGLGLSLGHLNRYDEARIAIGRALELNPDQPTAKAILESLPPPESEAPSSSR